MARLVCLVVVAVAVSVTWAAAAAGVEPPPPGPVLGLHPAALTPNNTHMSGISDGETSIGKRGGKFGRPTLSCTRVGGYCIRKGKTCSGATDPKACIGGGWKCCMPCILPDCKPKPCCSFAGGHCIKDAAHCPYGVIDRRGCKGPGCMCCLPSSAGLPWLYLNYSDDSGGDAFVPFSNITTDWYTAQCICRKHGLNLYHPNNIEAVSDYLRDHHTASDYYWIGSKGDGDAQKWLNGDVLPESYPTWIIENDGTEFYYTGINCCVVMVAETGTWTGYIFTFPNDQDICNSQEAADNVSPLCG